MLLTLMENDFKRVLQNFLVIAPLAMGPLFMLTMPNELFGMYVLMGITVNGLGLSAVLIAEEKEKRTLNTLLLANVKITQIIASKVAVSILFILVSSLIMYFMVSAYEYVYLYRFIIGVTLGSVASLILGLIIGVCTKSQMVASTIAGVAGMILTFSMDMLHWSNLPDFLVEILARFYTFSLGRLALMPANHYFGLWHDILWSLVNIAIFFGVFLLIYKKRARKI